MALSLQRKGGFGLQEVLDGKSAQVSKKGNWNYRNPL
jgi:hypothetical protein